MMFVRSLILALSLVVPAFAEMPTVTVDCSKATEPCDENTLKSIASRVMLHVPAGSVVHGKWCIVAVADDCLMSYDLDSKTMIQTVPSRVERPGAPMTTAPGHRPAIGSQLDGPALR